MAQEQSALPLRMLYIEDNALVREGPLRTPPRRMTRAFPGQPPVRTAVRTI
jgi:hypothetical protein